MKITFAFLIIASLTSIPSTATTTTRTSASTTSTSSAASTGSTTYSQSSGIDTNARDELAEDVGGDSTSTNDLMIQTLLTDNKVNEAQDSTSPTPTDESKESSDSNGNNENNEGTTKHSKNTNDPNNNADPIQIIYDWENIGKDLLEIGTLGYELGCSIAISHDGKNLAIGAPGAGDTTTNSNNIGNVRVFKRKKRKWIQRGRDLKGYGHIVSISNNGKVLGIGSDHNDNVHWFDGEIQLFQYKAKSDRWISLGSVHGGLASTFFGTSSGNTNKQIAIGATGHDGFNITEEGSVRIYHRLFQNKTTQHSRDIIL